MKNYYIIGGFVVIVLIGIFFCQISDYLNLNLCPDVSHTISYGDSTDETLQGNDQQ